MTKQYKPLTLKLAWNLAAPRTWVASICPAIFGIAYCRIEGLPLKWWVCILLLIACILLQSSVNTLNDYMDYIKGTDDKDDCLEEADAVLVYGGINPQNALALGIGYLAVGVSFGIICGLQNGLYPFLIGFVGVAVIALYSCGPHPISYLPVGEMISGGVMGGLIPLGICACADGRIHEKVLLVGLPFILGIALIMLCNNSCDIEKDMEAGRKTFPVVVGRSRALMVYRAAILLWAGLLVMVPILWLGYMGILCTILFLLMASKPFQSLWMLKLEPSDRIRQMKTIAQANLMGNGAYCLTLLTVCLIGMIKG